MSEFAERLRSTRELGEVPAYELAKLAGLSAAYVGHLERGRVKKPGMDAVASLARVLGVSIDYLVAGTGDPPTKDSVMSAIQSAREAREPAA